MRIVYERPTKAERVKPNQIFFLILYKGNESLAVPIIEGDPPPLHVCGGSLAPSEQATELTYGSFTV